MKQMLILFVLVAIACSADTILSPHPEEFASFNRVSDAIHSIDQLHLQYDDVTDESITTAILDAADKFRLNDDELQQVVDHYAD